MPDSTAAAGATGNYVRQGLALFATFGDAEAMVAADGRRFSYADLCRRIRATSATLWDHGMRPGMTIGLLAVNPPESLFVQLAAHLIGCRTLLMAHSTPPVFLRDVLTFTEADAFVYETAHIGKLGEQLAHGVAGLPIFCIGPDGLGPDLCDAPVVTTLPFDPDEITVVPQSLFQTSGTTGTPKLVRHGQRFFNRIQRVAEFYRPPDGRLIRHLLMAATSHSGSQSAALMTWFSGGTLVITRGVEPGVFLATIERERVTSTMLTPALLYLLLDDPRLGPADVSSLTSVTIGASPATPARLIQAIQRFGPVINVVYGMSEIPIITALTGLDPADPDRLASCGGAWGDALVQVRDAAGVVLPADTVGEIWVTGDLVTDGYWGMPELTAESLVDGWLRTGDVGRLDVRGELYIVDRIKDMILTGIGGSMVFSRPLEDALAAHPQVRQAAIIGVPDDRFGEAVYAYVVCTPDATVTAAQLRQLVVERLNAGWSPREVEFIDALPLTGSGKVDKLALRARYASRTAGLAHA